MLDLVRELAGEMGVDVAWHTGSVPQIRRREEINRFKHDPACRLFLSTDSGSVGLNLQAASAVSNLDLPWNPAKLEQRIARAWRKHQTRSVAVINLVAEKTIEHSILHLLDAKQALSDGLLDGQGEVGALKMPSGRGALIARMQAMLDEVETLGPRIVRPEEALAARLRERHGERVLRIEARTTAEGARRMVAILDLDPQALAAEEALLRDKGVPVEVVDRASWLALRRLAAAGVVGLAGGEACVRYATAEFADPAPAAVDTPRDQASVWREQAERSIRMASVLAAGGFPEEAPAQFAKALQCLATAHRRAAGEGTAAPAATDPEEICAFADGADSAELTAVLAVVRPGAAPPTAAEAANLADAISRLIARLWPADIVGARKGAPSSKHLAA
jgi:hypothetical protein